MTNAQKVRESCSETDAHLRLEALKEILRLYKERDGNHHDCPLCDLGCTGCPWQVFLNTFCGDYREKHFDGHFLGDYECRDYAVSRAWRKRRLQQLPRWIGHYEEALANWRNK